MSPAPARNGVGEFALVAGIVAIVFSIVPIVGEFVAAPASVMAFTAGCLGINRVDRGVATNPGPAWLGLGFGVVAGFITVLMLVATMGMGS